MLYVMISRVKEASKFRCMPLSKAFDRKILYNLRPKIGATKWRMDISDGGYWCQRDIGKLACIGKNFAAVNKMPQIVRPKILAPERRQCMDSESPTKHHTTKNSESSGNSFISNSRNQVDEWVRFAHNGVLINGLFYVPEDVPGDGNCFYHAVLKSGLLTPIEDVMSLRLCIVTKCQANFSQLED